MRFSFALISIGILVFFILLSIFLKLSIVALLMISGITIVFFFVVDWLLLLPLKKLHISIKYIEQEKYDTRLPKELLKETKGVFEAFNDMAAHLEETKQRAVLVNRMKSEFLSITAHQLRTPLSAVKWVMRMLVEGDVGALKKEQEVLLEKGYEANERMITLVNDLLDVVRIEEGKFNYKFQKGSVVEIVEAIVREVSIVAEAKAIVLSFHKPSHDFPDAFFDMGKFHLAMTNILENAIQYTSEKGRVDVEITLNDDEIFVMVRDTGIGIPKGEVARIFTKFFRAKNAVLMQPNGSGLGLFIAKNIIEKHGGKVWVESEEDKGTTVFFTLPARR